MSTGKTKRERILFLVTCILGVITVLQLCVIRPGIRKVNHLLYKTRASSQDLQKMQNVLQKKEQVATAYETIRQQITSTRTPMQEGINMVQVIEEAAQSSNVQITENDYRGATPLEYSSQRIANRHAAHFRGKGEAQDLMRMLYALQNPKLLLRIPSMKFSMKESKLDIELEITRVVYTVEQNGQS
jgi:hypothetical protein